MDPGAIRKMPSRAKWARQDSNLQPDRYEGCSPTVTR